MRNRALKTIVCLIMVVGVLCFSMSVYAVEELVIPTDNPQTIIDETSDYYWRMWIWGALKAFGINISVNDVYEYTELLDEYMEDLILAYINEIPSISDWNTWIFPWAGAINSSGFFEGNASFVEDVNDFTEWLVSKYNLSDNTTASLYNYEYITMDGVQYPVYGAPYSVYTTLQNDVYYWWYPAYASNNQNTVGYDVLADKVGFQLNRTYQLESGYYFRVDTTIRIAGVYSDEQCTNRVAGYSWTGGTNESFLDGFYYTRNDLHPAWPGNSSWYSYNGHNQIYFYKDYIQRLPSRYHYDMVVDIEWRNGTGYYNDRAGSEIIFDDEDYSLYFLPHAFNGTASTGAIVVPNDDENYTPGDSIVIINGSPNYQIIEFPDSVKVSNLPASIIPANLQNPNLQSAYTPIVNFVNLARDGMQTVNTIVTSMPNYGKVCIYAVMSGVILLGILKLFREH